MGKFAVFAGDSHDEKGGWNDLHSLHETEKAARAAAPLPHPPPPPAYQFVSPDWWQIVDLEGGVVVAHAFWTSSGLPLGSRPRWLIDDGPYGG